MSIEELIVEMLPFLMLPVAFATLRAIFQIIKNIAQGCYLADMKDEIKRTEKELIKEPEKINIDKDLQKYFNYKE